MCSLGPNSGSLRHPMQASEIGVMLPFAASYMPISKHDYGAPGVVH
jgi:hypothetical protein